MTEREYIDLSDRVRLTSALSILREIIPENSNVIDPEEFKKARACLAKYEHLLWGKVRETKEKKEKP